MQFLDLLEVGVELLPHFLVPEVLQHGLGSLVARLARGDLQVFAAPVLHLLVEADLENVQTLDHSVHVLRVEGQRLLQLVEDAHKVEHEPRWLPAAVLVLVGPVHPRDGLQQHVVAHRLVEVHAVEDRGVEAGQQLLGDDQDAGFLVGFAEPLAD